MNEQKILNFAGNSIGPIKTIYHPKNNRISNLTRNNPSTINHQSSTII